MRKLIVLILFLSISGLSFSTTFARKPLDELVGKSDHILEVTIIDVTMIDEKGEIINNPATKTGPGLKNIIRLHASVNTDGVIKSSSRKLPQTIIIPLASKWHYSLGQISKEKGHMMIVLLKGDDFYPVYPAQFRQHLDNKQKIKELAKMPPLQVVLRNIKQPLNKRVHKD